MPPALLRTGLALALAAGALAAVVAQSTPPPAPPLPPAMLRDARQLLLVVTPGWNEVRGELRRFERTVPGAPWTPVGAAGAIVVGRSGLAWDPLAEAVVPGPRKAEGDGRSPAGVFTLGQAFGYAPASEAAWLKLPYLPVVEGVECVDDVKSSVYNQIVNRRAVREPDWTSSEKMRDVGEAYRWGVVVNYNTPAVAGRGSCIFLHIGGASGTAGCTAMDAAVLRDAMAWLDPARAPVLVQLTNEAYQRLRQPWSLP
jgi:L,D-peptidoglycan transpeptidase YkuD (ErfK/YbiS/YcfS/YnhG family)